MAVVKDIVNFKCVKCGNEFAVDESDIVEDSTYYIECEKCGEGFYRRKPISDLNEKTRKIYFLRCVIAVLGSIAELCFFKFYISNIRVCPCY